MAQHLLTTFASSSSMMSSLLVRKMAQFPLGESKRVLSVQQPSGPSTSGGAQSRMALILEAHTEQPVCGFVDFVNLEAQIKDYVSARQSYELRYRRPFDVTQGEYETFIVQLKQALDEVNLKKFSVIQELVQVPTSEPVTPVGTNKTTLILAAVLGMTLLGALAAVALLLK